MTNLWHFWILRLHFNFFRCHLDSSLTMGQTEHLWGIQGKDTCVLFNAMGSRLTNKISRNVKQFFWEEGSDGWMDGWMDCWLDGWMVRRMAGSKINIKKTGFFLNRIFRNFSHTFWLVLLSWMKTVVFEHVSSKFYSCFDCQSRISSLDIRVS